MSVAARSLVAVARIAARPAFVRQPAVAGFKTTACAWGQGHGHGHGKHEPAFVTHPLPESRAPEAVNAGSADSAPTLNHPLLSTEPDRLPVQEEHVVGEEAIDYMRGLQGYPATETEKSLVLERKGTKTNPTYVEALNTERVVGCTGFPKESHEIIWIPVRAGWLSRCSRCGQAFKLKVVKGHDGLKAVAH